MHFLNNSNCMIKFSVFFLENVFIFLNYIENHRTFLKAYRLIEIDGTLIVPRTGRRGRAKRIMRNSTSFIIKVRERALFRGQSIHSFNSTRSS